LETNMFSPYPQSDIPFSNSTSWIGQWQNQYFQLIV
jgi:hypothetical protein